MINAIWTSVIHCLEEWEEAVKKGKLLLENKRPGIETILSSMVLEN